MQVVSFFGVLRPIYSWWGNSFWKC